MRVEKPDLRKGHERELYLKGYERMGHLYDTVEIRYFEP
jgi:hypothetical protein